MVACLPPDGTVRVVTPRPAEVTPRALETLPDRTVADTGLTSLLLGCSRNDCQPNGSLPARAGNADGPVRIAVVAAATSAARLIERHRCPTVDASPILPLPLSLSRRPPSRARSHRQPGAG